MATVTFDPLANESDGSPAVNVPLEEITVGPVAAPPLTFDGPLVLPENSRFFGIAEDLVDDIAPTGCQCALCAGLDGDQVSDGSGLGAKFSDHTNPMNGSGPGLFELLNLQRNPDGSYFFTGDRNVDAALIGSKWATLNLTYSFPESGSEYSAGYTNSNYPSAQMELGSFQQLAALDAFRQLSALTGLTFTEAEAGETAIIRISQTGSASLGSAQGHFPSDVANAGDIWFGRTSQPYYDHAEKGSWGFSTMMHEIGHTMGLKHGHQDYTNLNLSSYFGTSPRFGTRALEPQFDGQSWSLMTYTLTPGNSSFGGDKANQPQSYMQFDIAALQYMYGANFNTNSGASVYTWSETTGEMFINGVGQGAPGLNKIYQTIWDGDGIDTYDFSNYNNGVTVDLRPGAFSFFSQNQLANNTAAVNGAAASYAPGNVANALLYNNDVRSLIENATGGDGNDSMIGNVANNVLTGGAGDDMLVGLGGSDRLVGGAGSDTAVFSDSTTGITVTLDGGAGDVTVVNGSDTDIINGVENIVGTAFDDTMTGDALNNRLDGGASGHDVLSGGAGDDQLIGGGFTTGYDTTFTTPDIVKSQATANTSIATAISIAGAFDVQAHPDITNATTLPHATINATAAGGVEYYRIDVTSAGQTAIFDIDTGTTGTLSDSVIALYNSSGVKISNNDTGPGDPGSEPPSASHDDSYLTYTFAAPGVYYIAVGRYTNSTATPSPMLTGQTYTLHVSFSGGMTQLANNTSSAVLDGGAGDDLLQGTLGDDILNGGADNDTASYVTMFSTDSVGVSVDLNQQGAAQNTVRAGNDTLTGIENLIGSAYNDTLTGDAGTNVIEGGAGDDTIDAQDGDDTASYAGAAAAVTVSLALQGSAQNTGGAGADTLTGFENLRGSAFNDTLTGDVGANTLEGGAGDDILNGFAFNDDSAADTLIGGEGSDTASFAGYTGNVTVSLLSGTAVDSNSANTLATLIGIENLMGGAGADTLFGDANANNLSGGDGNDVLGGGGGDDRLEGGLGDDTLNGGAGANDTAVFSGAGAVTVDLNITGVQATGQGNDTLIGIENLQGGTGADIFIGNAANNTFFDVGGSTGGADHYDGGAGDDTVNYALSGAAVTLNLGLTTAQNANTGGDILASIENAVGTNFNDIILGSTAANRLTGGLGNDYLEGNIGDDILIGGAGNDILNGDLFNSLGSGNDILEGGDGFDTLIGGAGNDILRGGAGDDVLVGGIGNGTTAGLTQVFTNDGGWDTYEGGDGTDIAYAYYTDQTGAVAFDLSNFAGDSDITVGGVAAGHFSSIERIIWRGGSGDDVVTGTGTLDTLIGGAGNDTINGFLGNDTILGGLGDDILDGGEGVDTLSYVNATAGITIDLRVTTAQNTGGEGVDTISNFEYVVGSAFTDTIHGDDGFNLLTDGAFNSASGTVNGANGGGNDSIYGHGGDDMIIVSRLSAAPAGTILLDGGSGNDVITYQSGALSVTPAAAAAAGLGGSTVLALNARGDRFLDTLTINAGDGNDRVVITAVDSAMIDLGAGNDILAINMLGGAGVSDYFITTGTGADIIQLNANAAAGATTARASTVTDFSRGDAGDKFELNSYLPTTLAGYTNNTDFFASSHMRLLQEGVNMQLQVDRDGAGGANDWITVFTLENTYTGGFTAYNFDGFQAVHNIIGFANDETLTGGTKNDNLNGGDGDDILIGLTGDDTLNGGAGSDTARFSGVRSDYTFTLLSPTSVQVTGPDGTDVVTDVEFFAFDDGAFSFALVTDSTPPAAPVITGFADDTGLIGDGRTSDDTPTLSGTTEPNATVTIFRDGVSVGVATADAAGAWAFTSDALSLGIFAFTVSATDEAGNTGPLSPALTLTIINALATPGNDDLEGTSGADTIDGLAGDDVIHGLDGDDLLIGGLGVDRLNGGDGDDVLRGGAGFDVLNGGAGSDTADYSTSAAGVAIDLELGTAIGGDARGDTFNSIENVTGSAYADIIAGDAGGNVLSGGAGNDELDGGDGDDTLMGGAGLDILSGGAGTDTADYTGAAAGVTARLDRMQASNDGDGGTDTFDSIENLTGSVHDDVLFGDAGANIIRGGLGYDVLAGFDGDDIIYGGSGVGNELYGGAGNDRFVLEADDTVVEDVDGGIDTIEARVNFVSLAANVENLVFTGAGDFIGRGNTGDNVITGGDGDDRLSGGAGNDTLNGGSGHDVADYSAAAGGVTVRLDTGATLEDGDGGSDVLSGIEEILGSAFDDVIISGSGGDILRGGAGRDVLIGFGGDDILYGGAGEANELYGGTGDDYYVVSAGDTIVEHADEGIDTVDARVNSYTLGANIENLVFGGTGDFVGTGNALNNFIMGGAGDDVLRGGGGDDRLDGGLGHDEVHLRGAEGDYTITSEGAGYRIVDSVADRDGSTFVTEVEVLRFLTGNTTLALTPAAAPQTPDEARDAAGSEAGGDGALISPLLDDDAFVLPDLQALKDAGHNPQILPGLQDDNAWRGLLDAKSDGEPLILPPLIDTGHDFGGYIGGRHALVFDAPNHLAPYDIMG